MSVLKRVGAALAANAFGQVVTIGSLILLTPLFFRQWGAMTYGEWLILSSIPAYLALADLGIGTAAGNEMTMRAGAGDRRGAQQTYLGAWWVVAGVSAFVVLLGALAAVGALYVDFPATPSIAPDDKAVILLALALTVAIGFAGGVVQAGFRCCERNATGILLTNLSRLVDAVITGVLLLAGQSPVWVCLGMLASKAVLLVIQWSILRHVCSWLFTHGVGADRQIVRRLIKPALGFLTFPLGNAIALQGPILVIGVAFDGSAAAMFSALRTLARIPIQATNMLNWSVSPEMSRAFGSGDIALLRRLHRASWSATVAFIVVLALFLVVLGQWVVRQWLGPQVPFDSVVFLSLVLITVVSAVWNASWVVLAAINQHLRSGVTYALVNAACIALAALVSQHFGWIGLFVPMLLAELVLLLWVMPVALRVTEDTLPLFCRAVVGQSYARVRQTLARWLRGTR